MAPPFSSVIIPTMKILGIESSCDETAAAVVEDGVRLLSNVIRSQIDIHAVYGGVVPEVAARSHIEVVLPVIDEALAQARLTWDDIDAIGVTYAPGLVGSLLVGTLVARTLALVKNKPLYPVHHVEGHVYANFITEVSSQKITTSDNKPQESEPTSSFSEGSAFPAERGKTSRQLAPSVPEEKGVVGERGRPQFPLLALIVSGGHSQLVLFRDHGDFTLLGQTQDDAVGEAFDKVAKIIGLPYPGGPSVATAAERGNAQAFKFPKAKMPAMYDFSFSGLKTAVLRAVQREVGVPHTFPSHELPERVSDSLRADVAASFQRTAVETLVEKTMQAFHDYSPTSVVIAGGVAANQELRRQLAQALPIDIAYAPMNLCTDNAAMIASLAYFHAQALPATSPYDLEVIPSLRMTPWAK